jgi:hypothetical protein
MATFTETQLRTLQRSAERIAQQVTNAVDGQREQIHPAATLAIIEAAGRNLADMIATVKAFGVKAKTKITWRLGHLLGCRGGR